MSFLVAGILSFICALVNVFGYNVIKYKAENSSRNKSITNLIMINIITCTGLIIVAIFRDFVPYKIYQSILAITSITPFVIVSLVGFHFIRKERVFNIRITVDEDTIDTSINRINKISHVLSMCDKPTANRLLRSINKNFRIETKEYYLCDYIRFYVNDREVDQIKLLGRVNDRDEIIHYLENFNNMIRKNQI